VLPKVVLVDRAVSAYVANGIPVTDRDRERLSTMTEPALKHLAECWEMRAAGKNWEPGAEDAPDLFSRGTPIRDVIHYLRRLSGFTRQPAQTTPGAAVLRAENQYHGDVPLRSVEG
jgi:hypothetical protein